MWLPLFTGVVYGSALGVAEKKFVVVNPLITTVCYGMHVGAFLQNLSDTPARFPLKLGCALSSVSASMMLGWVIGKA